MITLPNSEFLGSSNKKQDLGVPLGWRRQNSKPEKAKTMRTCGTNDVREFNRKRKCFDEFLNFPSCLQLNVNQRMPKNKEWLVRNKKNNPKSSHKSHKPECKDLLTDGYYVEFSEKYGLNNRAKLAIH